MAFLPGLTTTRPSQNVKERRKRCQEGKKSGYRISFADVNKTTEQSDCNVVARYRNDRNSTGKRKTTGHGKSLTFELAPHAFEYLSENNKSLVLVVVPLVSLMKDQVSNLVRPS
ncbi:Hypothetical predicted protein [Paramuricea clavata]|uniref:Uncharacterized protein n=1 Tax=Paramuricea clavata TaxID=317549 RepID=A0A7D9E7B7_PARCT|nr:Hypothetical predicted protein [Paramuricea clavata]